MNATTEYQPDAVEAAEQVHRSRTRGVVRPGSGPVITIVTVVMNAAVTFRRTLDSIQKQQYENIEYIVIDGGSTDGTLDLIREYDHIISHWVSEADRGIYDAMNKALALAQGDWLLFLGADDQLVAPITSIASKMREKHSIYYGDVRLLETGKIYGGRFSRYKLMQRNICHQAIFYPRSVYKHKYYDTTVGMQADYLYNIQLWGHKIPFKRLGIVVSNFSIRGLSNGTSMDFERTKLAAIKASFGHHYYTAKLVRNLAVRTVKALLRRP